MVNNIKMANFNKKKIIGKTAVLCCAAVWCVSACSCAVTDWIAPNEETSVSEETTAPVSSERKIETTKVSKSLGMVDNNDEDMEGYTTTTEITGGTLENEYKPEDGYDEDIRATMTSKTTTVSSKESGKKTSKTTAAKFDASALYPLDSSNKYSSAVKYTVNSDTTYLNLRYGPSKNYNVQLKIPNKAEIEGTGETLNSDEGTWVYVTYKGTSGWVMKSLLIKSE